MESDSCLSCGYWDEPQFPGRCYLRAKYGRCVRFMWGYSRNRELAIHAESLVFSRLRDRGYSVERSAENESYDALVNGVLRLEVKAARWYSCEARHGGRYQANLHRNGFDVLVLVCFDSSGELFYFVFRREDLAGKQVFAVTSRDCSRYRGKWARFLDGWGVLDEELTALGLPFQLSLC